MKSIVLLLVVIAALPARAESTIALVPNVEELTHARQEQVRGRNLIIASAALQGVGAILIGSTGSGSYGNGINMLAVDFVGTVLGFTSLALIPAGIVYWTRGARHERLELIGTTIAPARAAKYERAGTIMLYVAGALGTASTVLSVFDMYGARNGVTESNIATCVGGAALTAVGLPLTIAGHRHAHVQLGAGSVGGTF